ncbi:hypothetical protein PFX98_13290 [Paucibacter sediminis]|uniref:PEP-CTERM sorting domain-containing protein n=1 Tax=Paucibacter sediminis TaxID=3019553 RepID=A0AA95N9M7_9BURK|nr:hypothetical protein [Paucibacter sp. S2-9]WIT09910.1 hypothetical protein PFX98_13290 [Paucibacter sp. S2-9]
MNKHRLPSLTALALACASLGPAQAGVVVGSYDPQFGPTLPELSYRGSFSFNLPDSWVDYALSHNNDFVDLTGENIWASVNLTLFETANPANAVSASFNMHVDLVEIDRTLLHLRSWSSFSAATPNQLNGFAAANFNQFSFQYDYGLPQLTCLHCNDPDPGSSAEDVQADLLGFDQLVFHRDDAGQGRLGKDGNGHELGLRSTINDQGLVVYSQAALPGSGQQVPEPGTLYEALAALAALLLIPRRRP